MKKILARVAPFLLFAPFFVFAQQDDLGGIGDFFKVIIDFINDILVPLVFAIAFLVFLWGMFKTFILGGGDEDKQKEGKQLMMYAIVGFVVMVSLWGIVNLIAGGFGFSGKDLQNIPDVPER